jgi:hypothetical protein
MDFGTNVGAGSHNVIPKLYNGIKELKSEQPIGSVPPEESQV